MPRHTFTVTLQPGKDGSTHQSLILLTPEQSAVLGSRRTVNITGTLNGAAFRNSFLPAGDGRHYLVVSRALRQAAGVSLGEKTKLTFEIEAAPRPVVVPNDLRQALAASPRALLAFDKLPPSHQRQHLGYIAEARKPETRARRIAQTVEKLNGH
jgi:hypothetical protein